MGRSNLFLGFYMGRNHGLCRKCAKVEKYSKIGEHKNTIFALAGKIIL